MSDDLGRPADADGLSSNDRAPAGLAGSAASIPGAFEPISYDDGYPEDEEFSAFEYLGLDFYASAHWLLAELPRACENMPCWCEVEDGTSEHSEKPVKIIKFITGGWSGAESIISLIERRFDMSHFMLSWKRGGHFTFEVPIHFLEYTSQAQAIEARRAETHSGSVADESAVPQGCATPSTATATIGKPGNATAVSDPARDQHGE